ncbi:MAG: hypothetical protein JNM99_21575 [Verrucomicrobiaceae bacterium]|nr:hypothetical protein [Verrucomicrobiaceae bacterium]
MKNFDQRWLTAAKEARRAASEPVPHLPLGFAARVLARSRDLQEPAWPELVAALSLRALIVTTVLCLVSGGYAFSQWYQPRLEVPELENPLTTDLTWP